jgi:hypothetical protein
MNLIDLTSGTSMALPTNLLWTNELDWINATAKVDRSLTGALIIQSAAKVLGREIDLEPADDEMSWIQRPGLLLLREWANTPDRRLKLVIQYDDSADREFIVRFRHEDNPVQAVPVYRWQANDANAWYRVTIKLMEIE